MTIVNHEYFVSLEVAKLLKQAGFDWRCNGTFLSEDGTQYAFIKMDAACDSNNSKYNPYNISAPTIEVAQRWLREVKNIDINVLVESISSHKQYLVSIWFNISSNSSYDNIVLDNRYTTYEEALEAGIKKALEIIFRERGIRL